MNEHGSIFKCLGVVAGVGAAIYLIMGRRGQQGMSDAKLKAEVASKRVLGMKEDEAVRLLESNDLVPRLAWRAEWPKDYPYALTLDLRPNRVNYRVKDGAVSGAWVG